MRAPLEAYINELLDPKKPIVASRLSSLSYLAPEELKLFKEKLRATTPKRKLDVLERLILLGTDNSSLNFDEIFSFCLSDGSPEVRLKAVEALSGTEETPVVRLVIKILLDDADKRVKASACSFLAPIALKAELGGLSESLAHQVETALWSAWVDESSGTECKCCALESLSYLSKHEILKAIDEAYHSKNKELIMSSLMGMGRNLDPRWIPLIAQELANPDQDIRLEAISACGEMAHEFFVPHLLPLLDDPEPSIKFAVITTLGQIGDPVAEEKLRSISKSEEPEIREAALNALEELLAGKDPFHLPVLD